MGHATSKIELIVLGGSWSDYPERYQIWFVKELFRALNDGLKQCAQTQAQEIRQIYRQAGISSQAKTLAAEADIWQQRQQADELTYNQIIRRRYIEDERWQRIAARQQATYDQLASQQLANETSAHRVVGLVVETRPDAINGASLTMLRRLGCTKVQVGIQSIDPVVLQKNNRNITTDVLTMAFEQLRLFGFKIHAHYMLNLYGSDPIADVSSYQQFVSSENYAPDEIKLYPCSLVAGTALCALYDSRAWRPYTQEELLDVLEACALATPPFVRISRMIRDISAKDIVAGNKKANLRQMVESGIASRNMQLREIRAREISTNIIEPTRLGLAIIRYETTVTTEFFLEWVTDQYKLAGFLRLSLPKQAAFKDVEKNALTHQAEHSPAQASEAMIREVHVYGRAAKLEKPVLQEDSLSDSLAAIAQHRGLGRQLIQEACELALEQGYSSISVISSVGTREYYRSLGFSDVGLYQKKKLA
jgi:elongator complex protein 3